MKSFQQKCCVVILGPRWKIDGVYSFETGQSDIYRYKVNHQTNISGAYKDNNQYMLETGHDTGKYTLFHCCFGLLRMLAYKISACEVWKIWRKPTELFKSIANRRIGDWAASNGHIKHTTRLLHDPWHDPVREHICVQPFVMWKRLCFHSFFAGLTNISKMQKRCK